MRFLVGVILTLFALWSGYWLVGERMIESRIVGLLAQNLPPGVTLTQGGVDVAGFPNRFDLTVTDPVLSDAATGWGWSADFAQIFAMTWKPWHLIAALPPIQRLQTPAGPLDLGSTRFMASFKVAPSAEMPFAEAVLEVENARLSGASLVPMQARKLVLALKGHPAAGFAYRLGAQVEGLSALTPGAAPMQQARLDAVLITSAALDRNVAQTNPDLTEIDLRALSMTRDAVTINGAGRITVSPEGFAEGTVDFKIDGWREVPQMLADFGLIKPEIAPTLAKALSLIAKDQGDPKVLSLPLVYKAGRSYLGPMPLGRAPILAQRQ